MNKYIILFLFSSLTSLLCSADNKSKLITMLKNIEEDVAQHSTIVNHYAGRNLNKELRDAKTKLEKHVLSCKNVLKVQQLKQDIQDYNFAYQSLQMAYEHRARVNEALKQCK